MCKKAGRIVASEDFLYVNNYANFESGKAYDDYIGGNTFGMTAEYLFNVIICGGESNINKKAREQLLDCLVSYVDADKLKDREMFDVVGDVFRGAYDVSPFVELNVNRVKMIHTINQHQAEIRSLFRAPRSKERKDELKKQISTLKRDFSRYSDDLWENGSHSEVNRLGQNATTFVTVVSYGVECIDDYVSYSAALTVLKNYDDVLNELKYCGNKNVEVAANTVYQDMQDIGEKYKTHAFDTASNFGDVMLSNFYSVILEENLKVKGLIVDLACLMASQVVGDAISVKIENAISVDCANGIALATNHHLLQGDYVADAEGNVNMVVTGREESRITSRLWTIDIYARSWCEQNYLGYLGKDRKWSMDDDFFLYKTPDSQKNAEDNVNQLGVLYGTY